MARVFTAEVVLQMLDKLSGPMSKTGKNVSREMGAIEKSLKQLNKVGVGLVATFAGVATVGVSLAKFAHNVRDLSRDLNSLAAAGTKVKTILDPKTGLSRTIIDRFTDKDRQEAITSANAQSRRLNISPAIPLTDQRIALLSNLTKEQARAVRGPYSEFAKSQSITEGEAPEIFKGLTAAMRDFKLAISDVTATEVTEKYARAASASGATVQQLLETTKIVGPLVAATGGSIDDMLALAMVAARKNIKGSELGVFYRSMIISQSAMKPKGLAAMAENMLKDVPLEPIPPNATKAQAKAIGDANMARLQAAYTQRYAPTVTQTGATLKEGFMGQFPGVQLGTENDKAFEEAAAEKNLERRGQLLRGLMDRYQVGTDPEERERAVSNLSIRQTTRIDVAKFIKDAIESGVTTPQFVKMIQGRQVGRLSAVEQDMVDYFIEQKKLHDVTAGGPSIIKAQVDEMNKGIDGAMSRIEHAMERLALQFNDPNNPAAQTMVKFLTQIANGIDLLGRLMSAENWTKRFDMIWETAKNNPVWATIGGIIGTAIAVSLSLKLGKFLLADLFGGAAWFWRLFRAAPEVPRPPGAPGVPEAPGAPGVPEAPGLGGGLWKGLGKGLLLGLFEQALEFWIDQALKKFAPALPPGAKPAPIGLVDALTDLYEQLFPKGKTGTPGFTPDMRHRFNEILQQGGPSTLQQGLRTKDDLGPYGGMTESAYNAMLAANKATEAIGKDFELMTTGFQDLEKRAQEAADALAKIPGGAVNPADAVSGFGHPVSGAWPAGISSSMFDGSRRGGTGARAYGGFAGAGPLSGGSGNFGSGIKFTGSVESARAFLAAGSYHRSRRGDTAFLHPELALHLAALLRAHPGLRLLSGYRLGPSVLGTHTMHGIGAASDVAGSERLSDAELARFGLYRPWRSAHERNHLQLIGSARHGSPLGYYALRAHGEDPDVRRRVWQMSAPIQVKSEIKLDKEKVGTAVTKHIYRRGRRVPSEIHPR